MSATWIEIRARSKEILSGLTVYCGDCWMAWLEAKLPCREHATDEERAALDDHIRAVLCGAPIQDLEPKPGVGRGDE